MATDLRSTKLLKYQPFSSILSPGFWQQLTNIKLNQLKLNKGPADIQGSYSCNLSDPIPCLASFDHNSFNTKPEIGNKSTCYLHGSMICTNIIQEFNDCVTNKKDFIQDYGREIWESILNGSALSDPEKHLSKCGLLVYADLKKYKFVYFFSFPALNYPKDVQLLTGSESLNNDDEKAPFTPILDVFSEDSLQKLQDEYDKPQSERNFSRGYFIVKYFKNTANGSGDLKIFPLTEYNEALKQQQNESETRLFFAFTDPSPSLQYPGWPLRNYLCLIAVKFNLNHVNIIRLRKGRSTSRSKSELQHSTLLEVSYQLNPNYQTESSISNNISEVPITTGWEMDGKKGEPKRVNLSSLLDPKKLAEDAVNLNLRLMKWRLLPSLDLDAIAATKCLLLGCGTLGCHISRGLLAWGIKNISIVDNAKISYSNPVRQTLYTFDDCAKSNSAFKASAAESSLKRIHPTANVDSYILSIPMPGHHIAEKEIEQTKKDVATLEHLIETHDVIFLLMDTRESRWLPTVIAMSKQKLVINAAIGFDTFLLQRYGIRNYSSTSQLNEQQQIQNDPCSFTSAPSTSLDIHSKDSKSKGIPCLESKKLGCYFCNDIVAPGDSTLDRTLDQQCTVSRPGVSMMVSALAIELLASIMSSRQGPLTPAPLEVNNDPSMQDDDCESELGIIPHSIRGNLSRYHIYMPTSPAFEKCSACSPAVVNAYTSTGFEFLQKVFDDPSYLEELAGLKDLQNVSDNVWALESDEEADDYSHIEKC